MFLVLYVERSFAIEPSRHDRKLRDTEAKKDIERRQIITYILLGKHRIIP